MARSTTPADLSGLCHRCWQRGDFCLCAEIVPVKTRTEILILRHAKETWRTSNTSRVASLALEGCRVLEVGVLDDDRARFEESVAGALATPPQNYLLFPWPGQPVIGDAPLRLIVPDGSWRQARRIVQRVPGLAGMPRFPLVATQTARLRRPTMANGMSTIEAIAEALEQIEGEAVARPLRALYEKMVARSLTVRRRMLKSTSR